MKSRETPTKKITHDFKDFLKRELSQRCEQNPAYSLRAFAKQLGVSHTSLSQVLSGKRPLTSKAQKQMALALNVSIEQFVKFKIPKTIKFEERFEPLDIDKFEFLSDWYHDAILELTRLRCFKPDPKWIARVLDVNVNQINIAVERLIKLGLLKVEKTGEWKDLSINNTNNHVGEFTNSALKKYQKDILSKSTQALDVLPRDQRDHTSLMLNFSGANMKAAKDMIKKFRTEFSAAAQNSEQVADDIYTLQISFFPISKTKNKELK